MSPAKQRKINAIFNILALATVLTYIAGLLFKYGFLVAGPLMFLEGFLLASAAAHFSKNSAP